jgi:hypothetical protein
MKTITDLLELIIKIEQTNKTKLVQFQVKIDLRYRYLSMRTFSECYDEEKGEMVEYITEDIDRINFDSPEGMQVAYWTLLNRVKDRVN